MTMSPARIRGVLAPVVTPFHEDLTPDGARFITHCRWLIDNQASLAIFGTNSEANSLSVGERLSLLEQLMAADIPASRLMPGTGACAIPDAVAMARNASQHGVGGLLVLPPFYYKGVSDDGLFAYYAEIIERVGGGCAPMYLYHIPQVSHVPITLGLIERLLKRYPSVVAGIKDSSGQWDNTQALFEQFGGCGFDIFPGSESFLSAAMAMGGAGCISATVNVNPAPIHALYERWSGAEGAAQQAKIDEVRKIFQGPNMIAAMKYMVGKASGDPRWGIVRPPLLALDTAAGQTLEVALAAVGFDMPDYPPVSR